MQLKRMISYLPVIISMLLFSIIGLTACNVEESSMEQPSVKKVSNYLYYMELADYDFSFLPKQESPLFNGGCSSIRKGNYYGRNLDLNYCEVPEFIIRIKAAPGRYGSINVCANPSISCDVSEMTREQLLAMPNITNDGINENGVVVSENIVHPTEVDDMTGTASGKEKIHSSHVVRYLLDHAKSAEHAVDLMKDLDIVGGFSGDGLHWMIADEKDTYVVEIIHNDLSISKNQYEYMTNFYLNYGEPQEEQTVANTAFYNLPLLSDYAIGVERWCKIRENYDQIDSMDDMAEVLASVKATSMYDESLQLPWYSECVTDSLPIQSQKTAFEQALKKQKNLYHTRDRKDPKGDWITWHSSIYDIQNRKLLIYSQEDYTQSYEYKLS